MNFYDLYTEALEKVAKNVPTSPEKWARAKAMARSKFDVYPSAYANGWAAKKYKEMGGGWKKEAELNKEAELDKEAVRRMARKAYNKVRAIAKSKRTQKVLRGAEIAGNIGTGVKSVYDVYQDHFAN